MHVPLRMRNCQPCFHLMQFCVIYQLELGSLQVSWYFRLIRKTRIQYKRVLSWITKTTVAVSQARCVHFRMLFNMCSVWIHIHIYLLNSFWGFISQSQANFIKQILYLLKLIIGCTSYTRNRSFGYVEWEYPCLP